jgi:hypothetical protein
MPAEREQVQARLVGLDAVGHDLAGPGRGVVSAPGLWVGPQVGQGEDAEFQGAILLVLSC